MNPIHIKKIENFAIFCIDNNLIGVIEKTLKVWRTPNNALLKDLFLELNGVDDSNYKTTKKEIYNFSYYYIDDSSNDPSYYLYALQVSIYEQLHKRKSFSND